MKMTLHAKVGGPDGYADWVTGWSDDYGLTSQIDGCLLGTGMYPNYEAYWTGVQRDPLAASEMTGKVPTKGECEWAEFAAKTPHYVLSSSLNSVRWPNTRLLRGLEEVIELKRQPGKDIYLMGGASITADLIDAGLVDEQALRDFGPRALAGRYPGPMLSVIQPQRDIEGALHRIPPGFPHVPIFGTGHWIQLDAPEEVASCLRDFVARAWTN